MNAMDIEQQRLKKRARRAFKLYLEEIKSIFGENASVCACINAENHFSNWTNAGANGLQKMYAHGIEVGIDEEPEKDE